MVSREDNIKNERVCLLKVFSDALGMDINCGKVMCILV